MTTKNAKKHEEGLRLRALQESGVRRHERAHRRTGWFLDGLFSVRAWVGGLIGYRGLGYWHLCTGFSIQISGKEIKRVNGRLYRFLENRLYWGEGGSDRVCHAHLLAVWRPCVLQLLPSRQLHALVVLW